MVKRCRELYTYRELFRSLVKKDLRGRYKGSVLGFFWTFLNPLLQLLVYFIVFSVILRVQVENYTAFMFVSLLPWIYFSSCTATANRLIIDQANIVKKIYFPRLILPFASACSGLINLSLSYLIALPVLHLLGINLGPSIILLPLILILHGVLVLGFGMLISSMNVYFRDIEHIWGIMLQVWIYITPILYPITMVPDKYKSLIHLNPMTSVILLYQKILYDGQFPSVDLVLEALCWALFMYFIGFSVFNKLERRFAEEI